MSFTVYILKCADGTHYTGQTADFAKRFKQHQAGYSKSTKWKRPLTPMWQTQVSTRKKARELEVHIKGRGARRYLYGIQLRDAFCHLCTITP
jgi:predicted GIY-YIG superfamily endonuclease